MIIRQDSGGAGSNQQKQRYKQVEFDEFEDDIEVRIGVIDIDEEEGISKERVNNFSNKNMISQAHLDSNMQTRGSLAKDRNF